MPEIGISGLIVILVVALIVFGPKRLPEMGRSLGKSMREFKDSISGSPSHDDREQVAALVDGESDGVVCRGCGKRNGSGVVYCDGCGSLLAATCPECGQEAGQEARYCSACGAALDAASAESAPMRAESPSG